MSMKGDLPTEHIVQLIELVLVVVVIGVILFMTVPQVSSWITRNVLNPLSGQGIPLGSTESTSLEASIKCSYFRCAEGCASGTVKNIDLGTKNCANDYCTPFQQGGKVCGTNAQNHPVVVTLLDNEFIDKSKIKTESVSCMMTSNGCYGYSVSGLTGEKGWIFVQKDATTDKAWEEEKCNTIIPIIAEITGYSRIMINAGKYNIWTDTQGGTVVCISQ